MVDDLREAAQQAVDALVGALRLNNLPALPSLEGGRITLTPHGVHIEIGGCNVRTVQAIADCLMDHARCSNRVVPGTVVSSGVAELSTVRMELSQ
ncbi:hypothetical protein P3T36_005447 [Kitasatospora sp. MAP12-15]|uniref:hypothetical protein n=1 Tax=unclassified Kitasatospora TaxID=2633591 RepID=UPI0024742E9F|nr:hypothetical protein [Kitasatospora sp. MAP12-44]MDH6109752.1 hypothetical protein [Kitasatospora sp. MAP12-44]